MSSMLPFLIGALMVLPLLAALFFVSRIRAKIPLEMISSDNPDARPSLDSQHFSIQTRYQPETLTWHATVQNGSQHLEFNHPTELIGYLQDFDGAVAKTALENVKNELKTMLKDIQKRG